MKKGIKTTVISHERIDADVSISHYDNASFVDARVELNFFMASAKNHSTRQPLILPERIKESFWFPQFSAELHEKHGDFEEIIENNFDISIGLLQEGLGRICVPELSPKYQLISTLSRLELVKMNVKAFAGIQFSKNISLVNRQHFLNFLSDINNDFAK